MSEKAHPIDILLPLFETGQLKHVLPSAYRADGMVFAVAAAPEIPMPEQWMPWLIQNSSSALVDKDVDTLADVLMNNLRAHLTFMRDEQIALPADCVYHSGAHQVPTAMSEWLAGLLYVHGQLEPVWKNAWEIFSSQPAVNKTVPLEGTEPPEKRLTRCLKLFSTLADVDLALKHRNAQQASELKDNLPLLWQQVPALLSDYVSLAGELSSTLPNQFETFTKQR